MIGLDPDSIFTAAQVVLTAVGNYYDTHMFPLPAVRAVVPGLPAFDCELFAVQVPSSGWHAGILGAESNFDQDYRSVGHSMRFALLDLWIVRCTPTFDDQANPPTAVALTDSARPILRDAVIMANAILDAESQGFLPGCGSVGFGQWVNVPDQGGFGGGHLTLRVDLTGMLPGV